MNRWLQSVGGIRSAPGAAMLLSLRHCSSRRRYKHRTKIFADDAVNPLTRPTPIDPAVLHVVSVPIGNVKDFTLRALDVLRQVDVIVCTNRLATKVFLELIDIDPSGRLVQYHRDGGNRKLAELLKSGSSMALVVPAGTPVVGDEGSEFVREMIASGIRVSAVPGASSIIAALSMCGVSMGSGAFFFGGNFASKPAERARQIAGCKHVNHPSAFFESPKRLLQTLAEAAAHMPSRRVAVVHEMTKMHEGMHSDTAERLAAFYARGESQTLLQKGQLVVVIEGSEAASRGSDIPQHELRRAVEEQLARGSSLAASVGIVAGALQVSPREVREAARSLSDARGNSVAPAPESPTGNGAALGAEGEAGKKAARAKRLKRRLRLLRKIQQRQQRLRLLQLRASPGGPAAD